MAQTLTKTNEATDKRFGTRQKLRPFFRGLMRGSPLLEVAYAGLQHPDSTLKQREKYLAKVLGSAQPRHLMAIIRGDVDECLPVCIGDGDPDYRTGTEIVPEHSVKIAAVKEILRRRKHSLLGILDRLDDFIIEKDHGRALNICKTAALLTVGPPAFVVGLMVPVIWALVNYGETAAILTVIGEGMVSALPLINRVAISRFETNLTRLLNETNDLPEQAREMLAFVTEPKLPAHEKEILIVKTSED